MGQLGENQRDGGSGEGRDIHRETDMERGEMTLKDLENVLTLESLLKTNH